MSKICSNKKCTHKGRVQPNDNFYHDGRYADGRKLLCKDCCLKVVAKSNYEKTETRRFYSLYSPI